MSHSLPAFRKPTAMERMFNKAFGLAVGLGLGLRHNYLLQVRGRTSGRLYSMPVNVLDLGHRRFLVAGRGRTEWVRNAEVAGEVTLKKGRSRRRLRVRFLGDAEKPPILAAYLQRFRLTVQRYFPVPAGSKPEALADIASRYPVVELLDADEQITQR